MWTLLSFQIFLISFHLQTGSATSVTPVVSTSSFVASNSTVDGSSSTEVVIMTTATLNTSTIQPSEVSSTVVTVPSSSVLSPSTSSPPSEGEQQAVLMTVAGMTIADFEREKSSFIIALEKAVEMYCSNRSCEETSRKRRATSVEQVYIVSGYPQESTFSPGELLVAVFISTGGGKFLSKDALFAAVEKFRANLSAALDKEITGLGRLHPDFVQATESSGSSEKSNILYYFFAAFGGALLLLAVCIFVTCWLGRKENSNGNEVRPLTTSNLQLVENQGGQKT